MSKVFQSALFLAFLAYPLYAAGAVQEPGHEGHNHPPGQGHDHDHPAQPQKPAVPTGPVQLTPVGADKVELLDGPRLGLIGARVAANRTATLPALLSYLEADGLIQNFAIAGGRAQGDRRGGIDSDAQVYAWIEGAALSLAQHKDAAVEAKLDAVIETIAAAQKPDGYLNTYFQTAKKGGPWSDLATGRELFVGGRLIEAALVHHSVTQKTKLLDVAKKFADHVDSTFGADKKKDPSGNPGIERALARLCDATNDERYLKLASFFVETRGKAEGRTGYGAIAQDQKPLRTETQFTGDPLRGTAFFAGAAEGARVGKDMSLIAPLDAIWTDAVKRKTNIVGALGNSQKSDGVTAAFDIGSNTTFDTRSAIGLAEWSQAMLLLTGDAKYADMVDIALHNAILGGISVSGTAHACTNKLASAVDFERSALPSCGECAADVARFMANAPGLVFAQGGNTIYISQFVPCRADFKIGDQTVHIEMDTKWPYAGLVDIKVQTDKQVTFSIKFRRPAWCKEVFYKHDLKEQEHGTKYETSEAGWEVYERRYDPLDGCLINFLGPVRREVPVAGVEGDAGRVAVCRGSLVYALEGVDNRGSARAMILPDSAALSAADRPDAKLTSIRVFKSRDGKVAAPGADGTPTARGAEIVFVPYHLLGNRPNPEMKSDFLVWVPKTPELATVAGSPPR